MANGSGFLRISVREMREKVVAILQKRGFPENEVECIADCVLYAQLGGNNQGLLKLKDINYQEPKEEVHEYQNGGHGVMRMYDAGNRHAMPALRDACNIAVEAAGLYHVGVVGVRGIYGSSGALSYFAQSIADEHGCVSIILASTLAIVTPTDEEYSGRALGTNPIAIGYPGAANAVVYDASTAASSYYGLLEAQLFGRPLRLGVAVDALGNPTENPNDALKGMLLPNGKMGFGLGVMIQLLAGPMVGAPDAGHLVIVMNPKGFPMDHRQRVEQEDAIFDRITRAGGRVPGSASTKVRKLILNRGNMDVDVRLWNKVLQQYYDGVEAPIKL